MIDKSHTLIIWLLNFDINMTSINCRASDFAFCNKMVRLGSLAGALGSFSGVNMGDARRAISVSL
jgi:hypothetical protein